MNIRPPPPPPPPQPSASSRILLMPQVRLPDIGTSPTVIKPTTAGLLPSSQLTDTMMQQVPHNENSSLPVMMNSRLFKDELLKKHSKLSGANDSSSIEDRIKLNKEETINGRPQRESSSEQYQIANMPEKLLSTVQREKRPFAYSPDVNDPNNRGKLDLNQIKSPTMRRRLLANMDSTEKEEGSDILDGFNVNDLSSNSMGKPVNNNSINYFQPSCSKKHPTAQNQTIFETRPTIQYNEPPLFYDTNHNQIQPSVCQDNYRTNPKTMNRIEELGIEVARSLDSLSQLVSNLQSRPISQPHTYEDKRNYGQTGPDFFQPQQRMSTFLPCDQFNGSRQYSNCSSPANSHSSMYNNRSVGDYLLSPDSNYFSIGSSASPYSISPYYGSPLDVENREMAPNYSKVKQTSGRTFSPSTQFNHVNPISSHNQTDRYFNTPTVGNSMRDSMLQESTSLRQEAEKLEAEFSRLQNIGNSIAKRGHKFNK